MKFSLTLRSRGTGPSIHLGYHKTHQDAECARSAMIILVGLVRDNDLYVTIDTVTSQEVQS